MRVLPHCVLLQKVICGQPGVLASRQRALPHVSARNLSYTRATAADAPSHTSSLQLVATSPLATQLAAHYFASSLHPGDAYLLYGEVGAGKSHFSRAFIRAALCDENAAVPSPTFLLQNIYPTGPDSPPLHHFDLYRLSIPHDVARLDLQRSLTQAVSLIEWAERLGELAPSERLDVRIAIVSEEERAAMENSRLVANNSKESEGEGCGEEEEEEYDGSDDFRWRRLELAAFGGRWQRRLETLRQHASLRGAEFGLVPIVK